MIKYRKLNDNVYLYKNKTHGIAHKHPYISFPKQLFKDLEIKLGQMVLIELGYKNLKIHFIGRISNGMHILLVWIPLEIIRAYDIVDNIPVNIKVILNPIKENEDKYYFNIINLNAPNIAVFQAEENKVIVRHNGSSKRQHKIKKTININENLAYIIGLYDAEGAENSFRFTNSDYFLIKQFIDSMKNIFGFDESEFDAQITLVRYNKESKKARNYWIKLFPQINIYQKAGFKLGKGLENGSLSVLINTITMNVLWNSIRKKVRELIIKNKKLAAAYISGDLDGDGNVHKSKSLAVRCSFDAKKGCRTFSEALDLLDIDHKKEYIKKNNLINVIITKWDEIVKLFYNNAIFAHNKERRRKIIREFLNHRRSKVIIRTLEAISDKNTDENTICAAMNIQKKHISRVRTYIKQLETHKMIIYHQNKFKICKNGYIFLNYLETDVI